MQHPLDTNDAIEHAEENHMAIQRSHPQAGCQVLAADVAQRGTADALALADQLGDETPGIGPVALGDVIADVEEVLPGLWRECERCRQVERLPLVLVACVPSGSE